MIKLVLLLLCLISIHEMLKLDIRLWHYDHSVIISGIMLDFQSFQCCA